MEAWSYMLNRCLGNCLSCWSSMVLTSSSHVIEILVGLLAPRLFIRSFRLDDVWTDVLTETSWKRLFFRAYLAFLLLVANGQCEWNSSDLSW